MDFFIRSQIESFKGKILVSIAFFKRLCNGMSPVLLLRMAELFKIGLNQTRRKLERLVTFS